jgi:hypothetical protein
MVVLIGIKKNVYQEKVGGSFLVDEVPEPVALFDNEKKAEEYVAKSKLKNPVFNTWGEDKIFKKKSLLGGCSDYDIEKYIELPCNPKAV